MRQAAEYAKLNCDVQQAQLAIASSAQRRQRAAECLENLAQRQFVAWEAAEKVDSRSGTDLLESACDNLRKSAEMYQTLLNDAVTEGWDVASLRTALGTSCIEVNEGLGELQMVTSGSALAAQRLEWLRKALAAVEPVLAGNRPMTNKKASYLSPGESLRLAVRTCRKWRRQLRPQKEARSELGVTFRKPVQLLQLLQRVNLTCCARSWVGSANRCREISHWRALFLARRRLE